MRVLHLSTRDIRGGAARAAYRLHDGLGGVGIDSRMLVMYKDSKDASVISTSRIPGEIDSRLRSRLDKLPLFRYRNTRPGPFSTAWVPSNVKEHVEEIDPDVIHLHWIAAGFLRAKTIESFDRPLVWTMHDMWPFTGGCHYSGSCTRYEERCGACPHLGSGTPADASRWVWKRKRRHWQTENVSFVAPSTWLAECARSSSLLDGIDVTVIPNGVDLDFFAPKDRQTMRAETGLPTDRIVVLFGAESATSDPRKGYDLLLEALELVEPDLGSSTVQFAVFGSGGSNGSSLPDSNSNHFGRVDDETLRDLYAAADMLVVPSREDNLPNTVVEGLACGTPCVAFDVGGVSDMVTHEENGYLASPDDPSDLAAGINWVAEDSERRTRLSSVARATARERFDIDNVANEYAALYRSMTVETIP